MRALTLLPTLVSRLALVAPIVGMAVGLAACGPISSTLVLNDTATAIEGAGAVGAEKWARFEYVSAVEYYRKAREEEAYSDFQAALDMAREAQKFAELSRLRALSNPKRGALPIAVDPVPESTDDESTDDSSDDDDDNTPPGSHL
ncbi:MAG: hypothetical protein EXR76_16620 [Myxococcales bacterium]|nr:hypothetical protein [Myxococcales bacterium]